MMKIWKEASVSQKTVSVVSVIFGLAVVVLAMLQILDVWNQAIHIFVPLMGVINLCLAYLQWNASRKIAYINLFTSAFIFVCAIVVFFIK